MYNQRSGGDSVSGGGVFGFGPELWGIVFIVFIIFAILLAFAWMRGDKRDHGLMDSLAPLLALLGMGKQKGGCDEERHHLDTAKELANSKGDIIHSQDKWAYDLKASQDQGTRYLEKRIDDVEKDALRRENAGLMSQLSTEKTVNAVTASHGDLRHEIMGIRGHFKPNWFGADAATCKG